MGIGGNGNVESHSRTSLLPRTTITVTTFGVCLTCPVFLEITPG